MIDDYKKSNRRIVIIGSMSVYPSMIKVAEHLNSFGIKTIVPHEEGDIVRQMSLLDFDQFKRRVSLSYLRKIRDPRTYCVLAMNLDKYGILNYIGPNTFAEIAVAFAQSKKIYLYQGIPETYIDELSAWRCVSLYGDLELIVNDFRNACLEESNQFDIFKI